MPYFNGDLSRNLLPSLDQMSRYIQTANRTSKRYRDVRALMSVLQRLPQVDLNLLGLMQTRKLAVLGFDHRIAMPEGIKTSDQETKRLGEISSRFKRSKMKSTFSAIMNGILFGASATRLVWKNMGGETMVVAKKLYELTELDFSLDSDDTLDEIVTDQSGMATRKPLDPETNIIVRYNPLDGIENGFIGSFMRTNMIYAWLKYYDYFNWAKGNEKFADPTIWASYKKGAEDADIQKVIEGLERLGTDSRAAFSDDVKLDLLEAQRSGSISAHKEFVSTINGEEAISILGQTLTTDVAQKGSFAAANVHNFVRQDIMWADLLIIQAVLSEQYVIEDYRQNYGEPADGFPEFQFITDGTEDSESNARIFSEVRTADPTVKFKKSQLYKKIGFEEPQDTDVVV